MLKLNQVLRYLRIIHDLKQKDLADKIDISRSHLSEIESGRKLPSFSVLERYSQNFNLPVYALIFLAEINTELPQPLIPKQVLTLHQLMIEINQNNQEKSLDLDSEKI